MVANLEEARRKIGKEMDTVRRKLDGKTAVEEGREELLREEESLQQKLDGILSGLADKREKLEEADRKLAELKARLKEGERQISESEQRQNELRRELESATSQVSRVHLDRVGSEALWMVLNDFRDATDSMPEETRIRFNDTLINDMASQGMNIIACAALLSMGMVDRATTFAENCGGGGGHAHGDWGRRKDEDDREWLRRCLSNARQMLRPVGRKLKR